MQAKGQTVLNKLITMKCILKSGLKIEKFWNLRSSAPLSPLSTTYRFCLNLQASTIPRWLGSSTTSQRGVQNLSHIKVETFTCASSSMLLMMSIVAKLPRSSSTHDFVMSAMFLQSNANKCEMWISAGSPACRWKQVFSTFAERCNFSCLSIWNTACT